jgi:LysM repeat protein
MRAFIKSRRWWLIISIVLLVVVASACFQPAGSALESTSIAFNAPTYTDTATLTPVATDTPTETSFPTIDVTETPEDVLPTDTESPTPTNTATPLEVADAALQDDPFAQTATAFSIQQTQSALEALGGVEDPVFEDAPPVEDDSSFFLTATYLVQQATQTFSVPLTQTSAALTALAQFPTLTPQPIVPDPIQPPITSGTDCIHEVRARDRNLFRIALAYGSTVEAIAQATGLANPALIRVGDRLVIPGCGTTGFQPPPTSTPIPTSSALPPADITCVSPYTVRTGDTLFRISLACGVTVREIQNVNSIVIADLIFVGEQLIIPGR